jgi:zinc D-Ala-D-Ala carboxypeptidase
LEKLWNFRKKLFVFLILCVTACIYFTSLSLGRNFGSEDVAKTTLHESPTIQVLASQKPSQDNLQVHMKLGHFPYQEAQESKLIVVSSYAQQDLQRFEKLTSDTALSLMKLIYAARDEDVWIIPVSGFRSLENQAQLFQSQIQKRGSEEAAAKISAPPGYSEHHTGYAVDVTDGHFPKKDTTLEFEGTDAFKWLVKHAHEYSFEMSFSKNNAQGVSYEPWHWRFVGTQQAKDIFSPAYQ